MKTVRHAHGNGLFGTAKTQCLGVRRIFKGFMQGVVVLEGHDCARGT